MFYRSTLSGVCNKLSDIVYDRMKSAKSIKDLPEMFNYKVVINTNFDYGNYGFTIIDHPFDPHEVLMCTGYIGGGAFNTSALYPEITAEDLASDILSMMMITTTENDDRGSRNRDATMRIPLLMEA